MAFDSATLALSTTAAALGDHSCTEVAISNNDASINMLLGNSAAQNFTLKPGQTCTIRVRNTNRIYAKSASGTPTLSYIWS